MYEWSKRGMMDRDSGQNLDSRLRMLTRDVRSCCQAISCRVAMPLRGLCMLEWVWGGKSLKRSNQLSDIYIGEYLSNRRSLISQYNASNRSHKSSLCNIQPPLSTVEPLLSPLHFSGITISPPPPISISLSPGSRS